MIKSKNGNFGCVMFHVNENCGRARAAPKAALGARSISGQGCPFTWKTRHLPGFWGPLPGFLLICRVAGFLPGFVNFLNFL